MLNLKKKSKAKKRYLQDRLYPNKQEREELFYGLVKYEQLQQMMETPQKNIQKCAKPKRKYAISQTPEIVLDAKNLSTESDFCIVDWSVKKVLAIALASSIYLWNSQTRQVYEFEVLNVDSQRDILDMDCQVCVLKWDKTGNHICFADTNCNWYVLDTFLGHCFITSKAKHKISTLCWHPKDEHGVICFGDVNGNIFGIGVDQKTIFHVAAHQNSQVLQIEWSSSGKKFASLGYDGQIHIWNYEELLQIYKLQKKWNQLVCQPCVTISLEREIFSVISWSPFCEWELLSATNKKICLWDSTQGKIIKQMYQNIAEGDVRRLVWGYNQDEFISGHSETGEIVFWNKNSFQSMGKVKGHGGGVYQMITSAPSRCWLVSGGADKTLKFWRLGPEWESEKLITNKFSQIVLR